eukprot:TRINITY_DN18766_c0_g1_i1.p2 TRINITY_DN18766_c0_g1~~TRINITY_DN18766_c0_g1_i1.p2  ORF type:complete len:313 (-),score=149.64 TRINITY_DN18766_c0_g1_i1:30-968(-)
MNRVNRIVGHLHTTDASVAASSGAQPEQAVSRASARLLEGQVAIITGSGQGIGRAAAELFVSHGAKVVVTDIDAAKSDAVAAALGEDAISVPGDVTDPAFPKRLVQATIDAFGQLDILINNAGFTWDGMLHTTSDKQWDAMLVVHNTAVFRLIRAAAPFMRGAGKAEIKSGRQPKPRFIVNVSSTSGLHGNVGQANYATAKMGVVGLTKTVAKEWGPFGVRCNTVAFGLVDTRLTRGKGTGETMKLKDGTKVKLGIPNADNKMRQQILKMTIPLQRGATPAEACGAFLMLSNATTASYVTGHTLECTGGAGI